MGDRERTPRILGAVLALAVAGLIMPAGDAPANHVQCGDIVTRDTTLDSDLIDCPGDGLVIGADDITVDLNGHTVDGDGDPWPFGCNTGIVNGRLGNCGSGHPGFNRVTVKDGTVQEFPHGVQIGDADQNSVLRLELRRNAGSGAIATYRMANGRIEGNRAFDNRSEAISVDAPTGHTTIARNVMGRNGYGLRLAGGTPGDRIEENVAFGQTYSGFLITESHGILVRSNRLVANGRDGMEVAGGATENRIEGNRVWDNGGGGISLADGAHRNQVVGNLVFRNARWVGSSTGTGGIVLWESNDNVLARNRVVANGSAGGLVFEAALNSVVAFNDVLDNTGSGIHFFPSPNSGIVHGNRLNGNWRDGLHVPGDALTIRNNVADRNGDDGIDAGGPLVTLASNTARRNLDLGIEAIPGVGDGGGNRAFGNGNPLQCVNVTCGRSSRVTRSRLPRRP